jgi:uncharacterized protein
MDDYLLTLTLQNAIEHDGSLYACDHYVYPIYSRGHIKRTSLSQAAFSAEQREFGLNKNRSLPRQCRECNFLFACNGECPKNRLIRTIDGEAGLNYLCDGLKKYFNHIDPYMKEITRRVKRGEPLENNMAINVA